MRPSWLAAALAILVVSTAAAQDTTHGDGFYALCNDAPNTQPDGWRRPLCLAYVNGLNDMAGYLQPPGKAGLVCAPQSVTIDQFLDALVQYLRDNPARRQELTAELLWEAAAKSYPCPGR
jgi:Rap1a immunity proteins